MRTIQHVTLLAAAARSGRGGARRPSAIGVERPTPQGRRRPRVRSRLVA